MSRTTGHQMINSMSAIFNKATNGEDMQDALLAAAATIGGYLVEFAPEDRGEIIIQLNKVLVEGMAAASKAIGEQSSITVVVQKKEGKKVWQ